MSFLLYGQRFIEKRGWVFAPFSLLFGLIVFFRNWLYDHGWLKIIQVPSVVVSVGNIVAGGSGKTPFVLHLARRFSQRKVAIIARMEDEAQMLAQRLPHVTVVAGRDRVALAKMLDADLIILDDGFQHRRLYRDFDVVLGDKKGHYLPWGFLRDSPKRLQKAEYFSARLAVKRILDLKGREVPSIRGWKVGLFCGIAKPEKFKKTVIGLGAEIVGEKIFGDHQPAKLNQLPEAEAFICTEKDRVKLPPTSLPIYYLEMETEIDSPEQWEKLIEKIDQKIDNRGHL